MTTHGFTGQRRRKAKRGGKWSQAKTRRGIVSYDQHDRPWSSQAENRSGMPTGPLNADFSAPWMPDGKYLIVNPDNVAEVYIDYPKMYRDRKGALEEYHGQAVRLASQQGWPVPDRGKYSEKVLNALGLPPKPLEPVVAAMQGNPYILGFIDQPDPRLVRFLNPKRREVTPEEIAGYDFGMDSYNAAIRGDRKEQKRQVAEILAEAERDLNAFRSEGHGASEDDAEVEAASEELDGFGEDDLDTLTDEPGPGEEETPLTEALLDLEDETDAQALGGRTVQPRQLDRVARQAPRRPTQTARRAGGGANKPAAGKAPAGKGSVKARRRAQLEGRRSLADGAAPGVSDL